MKDLITCVYRKDKANLERLLLKGFNINEQDNHGYNLLMHAILDSEFNTDFIKFLIQHGADIEHQESDNNMSCLHFAVQQGDINLVELILSHVIEVDYIDSNGRTPLRIAVLQYIDDDRIIRLLLTKGANPLKKDKFGKTTVDLAKMKNENLQTESSNHLVQLLTQTL